MWPYPRSVLKDIFLFGVDNKHDKHLVSWELVSEHLVIWDMVLIIAS